MTHIFAIADQQDERWNSFHRQAQDQRDSWASLRGKAARLGLQYGYDEASSIDMTAWARLQRLIDADELVDAEDLIRKYKGN